MVNRIKIPSAAARSAYIKMTEDGLAIVNKLQSESSVIKAFACSLLTRQYDCQGRHLGIAKGHLGYLSGSQQESGRSEEGS